MVAGRGQPLRAVAENGFAVVLNLADVAGHLFLRAYYFSAEGRANRLVSETNTQDRLLAGKVPDQINADARLMRRAWPRRNYDVVRPQRFDFLRCHLVVAPDFHLLSELAQILDQVVGERIVLVEDEDHLVALTCCTQRSPTRKHFGPFGHVLPDG